MSLIMRDTQSLNWLGHLLVTLFIQRVVNWLKLLDSDNTQWFSLAELRGLTLTSSTWFKIHLDPRHPYWQNYTNSAELQILLMAFYWIGHTPIIQFWCIVCMGVYWFMSEVYQHRSTIGRLRCHKSNQAGPPCFLQSDQICHQEAELWAEV